MATRLGEAHRLAQQRLGVTVATQALETWRLIDPANVDADTAQWLRVNRALVAQAKRTSAALTASYYLAVRRLAVPGRYVPKLMADIDADQLDTALLVTGPYRLKRNTGLGNTKALDIAKASSAASAMRLALQGGRDTLTANVKADARAIGYVRITSGDACAFCEGLAGETFSDADFEAHDGCSCTGEPRFG